jgi:hypothetical protein
MNIVRILALFVGLSVAGCSALKNPSPEDLADALAVARVTSHVGCAEVSRAIEADERDPLRASLVLVSAGLRSGRITDLDAALEALGVRNQGYRLLVGEAVRAAARRVPEDVRQHVAAQVGLAVVEGCIGGLDAGAP